MKRQNFHDKELNTLQQNVIDAIAPLEANILNGAIIIPSVALHAYPTVNIIKHNLNKRYTAVFPEVDGYAYVWFDTTSNTEPTKYIYVYSSAAVNAKFLIF